MKKQYISDKYKNLENSLLTQTIDPLLLYPDLVNFSLGDPDINTDSRIIQRAFEDALNGHTRYTESTGRLKLREDIATYFKERFDFTTSPENIMVTTSACHAMFLALEATLNSGDEVIIPTPHFSLYTDQVKLADGVPVYVETLEEEEFQLNIERLKSKITEKTRGIILNTPNNPTGATLSKRNLEDIAELSEEYDLIIYADDIYTIYTFEEEFFPIVSIEGMKDRTITLGSFSKDYSMTGWRIGYILASPDIIKVAGSINDNVVYSAPSISQQAAIHALDLRKEIQPYLYEEFKKRVFYAYERLKKLKNVSIMSPKGTFYLFPSIKATGLSSTQVADILMEEAHVMVIPGVAFGPGGEGFIRLACTMSIEKMKEGFDRMEKLSIFN